MVTKELVVKLKTPHDQQEKFISSLAKRKIIRAGRRSGKTTGVAMDAVEKFLDGRRVLYAAPTQDQTDKFWLEVTVALDAPIKAGVYKINQTRRYIERPGTENRLRAKTAWDADSLRGDYADYGIFDELQKMKVSVWNEVGAPMLLDNDGDAVFIYTPPRPGQGGDGAHAREMYKRAEKDETGRWSAFHFTSFDNPHISRDALDEISGDMGRLAYRREILAEDMEDHPDALWSREMIERNRVDSCPELELIVVGVDPPGKATGAKCGIIVGGRAQLNGQKHAFIRADMSRRGRPDQWGNAVMIAYNQFEADRVVGEVNNGGDMVEHTVRTAPGGDAISFKQVRASRGKITRAEPIAGYYAAGRVHHVGVFDELEDQMCLGGDTFIATSKGRKRIKNIKTGELVYTRAGLRLVLWAGMTNHAANVYRYIFEDGRHLVATVHHPVYNPDRGFIPFRKLGIGDRVGVAIWKSQNQQVNMENMVHNLNGMDLDGERPEKDIIETGENNYCTEQSGNPLMVPFHRECSSTTKMGIPKIMMRETLNWYRQVNINASTQADLLFGRKSRGRKKDSSFGADGKVDGLFALNVEQILNHDVCEPSIVIESVGALRTIEQIPLQERQPVYNLKVRGEPEFFANDILVHNCNWVPGQTSPDNMDGLVWTVAELLMGGGGWSIRIAN